MDSQYREQASALDMRDRQEYPDEGPEPAPNPRDFLDWLVVEFEADPDSVNYPPSCECKLRDKAYALTHGELIQWLMYPRMEVAGVAALELARRYEKTGGVL